MYELVEELVARGAARPWDARLRVVPNSKAIVK